jgi:membrane protein
VRRRARGLGAWIAAEASLAARAIARGTVEFLRGDDLTYASSIAYYGLLSLFPFFLVGFSVLGTVAADPADRAAVLAVVMKYFPRQLDFVESELDALARSRVPLGLGGLGVMVWAAMGVFGAVTSAINHAWRVERRPSFFKHKLVSFALLAAAALALLTVFLVVSAANLVAASAASAGLARAPGFALLQTFAVRLGAWLVPIAVVGLVFRFVPATAVRLRDVWAGAVVTGLLWQAAFAGFSWYVRDPSRYRAMHGSITAVVIFLIWVYLSAAILMFGAEVSAAAWRLRRSDGTTSRA